MIYLRFVFKGMMAEKSNVAVKGEKWFESEISVEF